MKTKNLLFILMLTGIAFTGCKKDKEDASPFQAKYTDLSSEENKQNVEDNGIAMVNELNQLKSSTAIEVAINFDTLNSIKSDNSDVVNIAPINLLASIGKSNNNEIANSLKTAMEEPFSIMKIWNKMTAKYTWNQTAQKWDSSGLSDAIVFEFPGKATDTENTATITLNNFKTVTITDPAFGMDTIVVPELPTSLKMELKYNGTTLSTYTFKASYDNTGMPTMTEIALNVDTYLISAKATHSPYSKATLTYSFKNANKILVEMKADATGNWSEENVDKNMIDKKEFEFVNYYGDSVYNYYTEPIIENIVTNGNVSFQLMNIKVAGMVDVKSLAPIYSQLETQEANGEITAKTHYAKLAEACNTYSQFVVVYADNNQKIAYGEFYGYDEVNSNGYDAGMKLRYVFSDGSKVNSEQYFKNDDDMIKQMNQFIMDINDDFDLVIEPIDLN